MRPSKKISQDPTSKPDPSLVVEKTPLESPNPESFGETINDSHVKLLTETSEKAKNESQSEVTVSNGIQIDEQKAPIPFLKQMTEKRDISKEQLLDNLAKSHTKKLPMHHQAQEPH